MKKNEKTATATATATMNDAQMDNVRTKNENKRARVELSTIVVLQDKNEMLNKKRALFRDMLNELRGIRANCDLFRKFANDERMQDVLRTAKIGVNKSDYPKIFTTDFIGENILSDGKVYKRNEFGDIVKRTATSNENTRKKYTDAGYATEIDEKSGKTIYLVPMPRYTFDQFLGLVREAIRNYFAQKVEEMQKKSE